MTNFISLSLFCQIKSDLAKLKYLEDNTQTSFFFMVDKKHDVMTTIRERQFLIAFL